MKVRPSYHVCQECWINYYMNKLWSFSTKTTFYINFNQDFEKNYSTDFRLSYLTDKISKDFDSGLLTGMQRCQILKIKCG